MQMIVSKKKCISFFVNLFKKNVYNHRYCYTLTNLKNNNNSKNNKYFSSLLNACRQFAVQVQQMKASCLVIDILDHGVFSCRICRESKRLFFFVFVKKKRAIILIPTVVQIINTYELYDEHLQFIFAAMCLCVRVCCISNILIKKPINQNYCQKKFFFSSYF